MGFGGKNRKSSGRRPSIPHHAKARRARAGRWILHAPDPWAWQKSYRDLMAETEKAIKQIMFNAAALGLESTALSRSVFGVDLVPRCTAAVALPDTGPDLKALVCALPAGHDDWHLDTTGARWCEDGAGVIVQPVAMLPIVTTEVRVKA